MAYSVPALAACETVPAIILQGELINDAYRIPTHLQDSKKFCVAAGAVS